MLLGMEFICQRKVHLDLGSGSMTLDWDTVLMIFGRAEGPSEAQILTVQFYPRGEKGEARSVHSSPAACDYVMDEHLKRDYNLKVGSCSYDVGDFVHILDTATVKWKCRTHSPSWKGPGLVIQRLNDHSTDPHPQVSYAHES
jgi:hypothetical protein